MTKMRPLIIWMAAFATVLTPSSASGQDRAVESVVGSRDYVIAVARAAVAPYVLNAPVSGQALLIEGLSVGDSSLIPDLRDAMVLLADTLGLPVVDSARFGSGEVKELLSVQVRRIDDSTPMSISVWIRAVVDLSAAFG